jgi:hypothetical protein
MLGDMDVHYFKEITDLGYPEEIQKLCSDEIIRNCKAL